jgi:hypothetical protein
MAHGGEFTEYFSSQIKGILETANNDQHNKGLSDIA